MKLSCIVFTQKGQQLAQRLLPCAHGWKTELHCGFGENKVNLHEWCKNAFFASDALLFIGAAGIAVRAVAPYVQSKTSDPAVVVIDEAGRWAVPLLSGHIGGANRLAKQLAAICGGEAVVTTATDVNGLWAVDEWAVQVGLIVVNPLRIKEVSGRLLQGKPVYVYSEMPLGGKLPAHVHLANDLSTAQVAVTPYCINRQDVLQLVPRCIKVGIGCRKGTSQQEIEAAFKQALDKAGVLAEAVDSVHSIDLKKEEEGLLLFCKAHQFDFYTHSADELKKVEGEFFASTFVKSVTGVDNVCERSALVNGGKLLIPKQVYNKVTVALAIKNILYSFEGAE